MGYRNAQEIFPEALLRQIQRYVSGETIYVLAREERKAWGETSGYLQYIRERNEQIRADYASGKTMDDLINQYALSYDSLKKIVYNRKENVMLRYNATRSSAMSYADAGKLDDWIHLYLNEEGRNVPFSDGLKLMDRYYFSPVLFPVSLLKRCAGPEPDMKYPIDPQWWAYHVKELETVIQTNADIPPFIVHYVDGAFELNDGNHRHQACENLGMEEVWVIFWMTEKEELDDFLLQYGEYVKDCKVIRR